MVRGLAGGDATGLGASQLVQIFIERLGGVHSAPEWSNGVDELRSRCACGAFIECVAGLQRCNGSRYFPFPGMRGNGCIAEPSLGCQHPENGEEDHSNHGQASLSRFEPAAGIPPGLMW